MALRYSQCPGFAMTLQRGQDVSSEGSRGKAPWDPVSYLCNFLGVYNYFKIKRQLTSPLKIPAVTMATRSDQNNPGLCAGLSWWRALGQEPALVGGARAFTQRNGIPC